MHINAPRVFPFFECSPLFIHFRREERETDE